MPTRKPSLLAPPSVSTADALALAMAGHDSALNDLFGRYLPTLKRSAHGRLPSKARDRNDTEDIVQDVFSQAWRQAARYDASKGRVAAWLLTLARSRSIDISSLGMILRSIKSRPTGV